MVDFNKGLDGFFHSLMPRTLRETLKPNTADYVRARALAAVLIICTLVPAVATLIVGGHHVFFNPGLLKHDLISLVLAAIFGIQALFYCRFGNQWLSSAALTNTYFLMIAVLLIVSGGLVSPMKAIIVTCPIMSFIIGGRQEGLQSTFITVLFMSGLSVLSAIDFALPNLFHEESPQMIFVVNWIGTNTIVAFCIIVYETELQSRCSFLKTQNKSAQPGVNNLSKRLDIFLHGLIPKILRDTLDPNSMGYIRVQTLSIMLCLATVMSAISALILVSVHLLFYKEQLKYDLVIAAIACVFGLQTWAFYKFNNFWLSSLTLSYVYLILTLLLASISGGYDAPTMVLILMSPIVFFMLGGIRQGIQNAIFVMIVGVFFGAMKSMGYDFPNVFRAAAPTLTYGIAFIISIVGVMLCIMVYDTELEKRS